MALASFLRRSRFNVDGPGLKVDPLTITELAGFMVFPTGYDLLGDESILDLKSFALLMTSWLPYCLPAPKRMED